MGPRTVYIETFGCQMSVADTERAKAELLSAGYTLCGSSGEADVVIFNTCSVRAKAERKVYRRVGEVERARGDRPALVGVMGCVAQLEGERVFDLRPRVGFVAGTRATDRIPELIERAARGERRVTDLGERPGGYDWNVAGGVRGSGTVAYVPVIEGCNKFCTYCIVPYSRGRERSRTAAEILDEVSGLIDGGYKEVQLIGQNVNSYRPATDRGLERHGGRTPFSRLLRAVAATGMPRVKFTTSFPRDFHEDIVAALDEHENLCNWVHLPVQSGSDRVLRAMRRGYKVADYMRRVASVRRSRRRIALTSDVIVGFPTETEGEFEDTLRLVEECRFEGLYIFKYSGRPGTPAYGMPDDVSPGEKAERFARLQEVQARIQAEAYGDYVGRTVGVLAEGLSARSVCDLTGHTSCHKVVNFRAEEASIGRLLSVRVTRANRNSLYGEVV